MFGSTYYHGIIRKYIIMFGTMFNDIDVQRFDKNGNRIQTIRIPIAYGPKEKFLVRLAADPNLDRDVAITLPRMSFEILDMAYNPTRKLPSTVKNAAILSTDAGKLNRQYAPVPYDFNIGLSIFVKNADDGVQILEQILPFFGPEWTNTLNIIPELDLKLDIPTVLTSVTTEDTYEGDFSVRRALIYNLNFLVKGYLFGPIKSQGVIKRTIVQTSLDLPTTTPLVSSLQVQPGLTANGTPTSSAAVTVPLNQISASSNYGFIEDLEYFYSGKAREN